MSSTAGNIEGDGVRALKNEAYTIGWLAALPHEAIAAKAALSEYHGRRPLSKHSRDNNSYILGRIGEHNVVIATFPGGMIGPTTAATTAAYLLTSFPSIRFGLLVGVGGGIPKIRKDRKTNKFTDRRDIRLGDVVISQPAGTHGGVKQYDFGKSVVIGDGFQPTGYLNSPPRSLLSAVGVLQQKVEEGSHQMPEFLERILGSLELARPRYTYPGSAYDQLYEASYKHLDYDETCEDCECDETKLILRPNRLTEAPMVHYGVIASGNQVIKDAEVRDRLGSDCICFEMEAAGLMNDFPCLVIRGVCDYADSHKNKGWQRYAAAAAAACAKEILHILSDVEVTGEPLARDLTDPDIEELKGLLDEVAQITQRVESKFHNIEDGEVMDWFSTAMISAFHTSVKECRTPQTGEWLLNSAIYKQCRESSGRLLWLYGPVGCGKTVLCSTIIEDIQKLCRKDVEKALAYWYFQFADEGTQSVNSVTRSLIRQLIKKPVPDDIKWLYEECKTRLRDLESEELLHILDTLIRDIPQVYIIIDALDECPQTPQLLERKKLITLLQALSKKHADNLHIVVTSRPEPDLDVAIWSENVIDIECNAKSDIQRYVKDSLCSGNMPNLQGWNKSIKRDIEHKLLSVNEPRFRWAALQISRLEACNTESQLLDTLRTLPESLEDTYRRTLESIPSKDSKIARKILIWLTSSFRPLRLKELAIAVDLSRPELALRICNTMLVTLVIHEDTLTHSFIRLAHFSVKEYLLSSISGEPKLSSYHFTSRIAHATVAKATIDMLLATNKEELGQKIRFKKELRYHALRLMTKRTLLSYASQFWHQHIREALDDIPVKLKEKVTKLFSEEYSRAFKIWLLSDDPGREQLVGGSSRSQIEGSLPSSLYCASFMGLHFVVEELLKNGAEIANENARYPNAIVAASSQCHSQVVSALLTRQARLSIRDICRSLRGMRGHRASVDRTLTAFMKPGFLHISGKRSNVKGRRDIPEQVVRAAVQNPELAEVIVAFLLAIPGARFTVTETIVRAAADNEAGGKGLMTLLIRKGKDVAEFSEGAVALTILRFDISLLQYLFEEQGGSVPVTERVVKAAVSSPRNGRQITELLLRERGAKVPLTDEVVRAAAQNRHEGRAAIECLLRERRGVPIPGKVVLEIVEWYDRTMMSLLVEEGSPDLAITEQVVLRIAQRFDGMLMHALLMKYGENVQITEGVVKAAAMNGQTGVEILSVLFDIRGARVPITDQVLKAAARNGVAGSKIIALLLEHDPKVRITEELVKAAAENRERI